MSTQKKGLRAKVAEWLDAGAQAPSGTDAELAAAVKVHCPENKVRAAKLGPPQRPSCHQRMAERRRFRDQPWEQTHPKHLKDS